MTHGAGQSLRAEKAERLTRRPVVPPRIDDRTMDEILWAHHQERMEAFMDETLERERDRDR